MLTLQDFGHGTAVHVYDLRSTVCTCKLKTGSQIEETMSKRYFDHIRVVIGQFHVFIMNRLDIAGIAPQKSLRIFSSGSEPANVRLCIYLFMTGMQQPLICSNAFQMLMNLSRLIVQQNRNAMWRQRVGSKNAGICKTLIGSDRDILRTFYNIL